MSGFITSVFQPMRLLRHGIYNLSQTPLTGLVKPDNCLVTLIRTKVRCYFPRPNEVKRVRRHGWEARKSTPNGRRVIMRRLLKGRYVLTH